MKIENDLCRECNGRGKLGRDYCPACNGTGIASDFNARRWAVVAYIVGMVVLIATLAYCGKVV